MRHIVIVCCLPFIGLLAGCAPGNHLPLTETALPDCTDFSAYSAATISAEQHYDAMVACVKRRQFAAATFHYASAGVQTWHDYLLRPGATSKARHQTMLRDHLARLSVGEKQQFWAVLYATLRDQQARQQLCSRLGPVPTEMASVVLWDNAKVGYLHCEQRHMF